MTTFTITIDDESHLTGIASARAAYNAVLTPTVDAEGNESPNPELLNTDEEYVQFVMSRAAESYAKQYGA
jgi:hypothetical protein